MTCKDPALRYRHPLNRGRIWSRAQSSMQTATGLLNHHTIRFSYYLCSRYIDIPIPQLITKLANCVAVRLPSSTTEIHDSYSSL